MPDLDQTHDPNLRSWIASANDPACDFPIQNLPFGVFTTSEDSPDSIGVAIGNSILSLDDAIEAEVLEVPAAIESAFGLMMLNEVMDCDRATRIELRRAISGLLSADNPTLRDNAPLRERLIVPMDSVEMVMPAFIGDYTDFYASIHHAKNVGSMFRPDNPLMPNYKHLPVGYHGRASSIVISETPIDRPMGQTKADDAELPTYGPSRLLDYELEMGFLVGASNELGRPIPMSESRKHIFGMVIVNDWSARDIQKWEYQPLGPFNAKNFATSISPWVVTLEALEPFRVSGADRGADDPPVLEYLQPTEDMGFDITVEAYLSSQQMRDDGVEPMRVSRGNFRDMYWTIAQMLVHHASTGCNMQSGDLLASGTVSGPAEDARGCLLERTWRGRDPLTLPDGSERRFLQDGDEVTITAFCERDGAARIGFGACSGIIQPTA